MSQAFAPGQLARNRTKSIAPVGLLARLRLKNSLVLGVFMMDSKIKFSIVAWLCLLAASCATVPMEKIHQDTASLVRDRTGQNLGTSESEQREQFVAATLKRKMSVQDAVALALVNNSAFKANLEDLGIARADVVQAGLPENPRVDTSLGFASSGSTGPLPHILATQNVLDFYLASLRRKAASSQLEETKLQTAHAALELIDRVKEAYYRLQALEHFRAVLKDMASSARTGAALSERQSESGNINSLQLNAQKVTAEQAEIELVRTEGDLRVARANLTKLLGLRDADKRWTIRSRLPTLPAKEPSLENLESRALEQRLDLAAMRQRNTTLEQNRKLAGWQAFPELRLGVETEKDADGSTRIGPEIDFQVPLFDRSQGRKARVGAQIRQNQYAVTALENQAIDEIRTARARLMEAREVARRYRDRLIPLLDETVEESLRHYNFMLKGVFDLLQARREQLTAQREYLEALKEYWTQRAHLEKAVGGSLAGGGHHE
jgi:cobalt-zinc-cadmium efflux system outer membrane protein